MFETYIKKISWQIFPYIVLFLAVLLFGAKLFPIISDQLLAGWDTPSHYALLVKMKELLLQGKIVGYDTSWFLGYPIFSLYAPLPYIILAGIHILLPFDISLIALFQTFLWSLPLVFLITSFVLLRSLLDSTHAAWGILWTSIFLLLPNFGHFGVGISGAIQIGLFNTLLGIILWQLLWIALLAFQKNPKKLVWFICCILLYAAIILTHILSAIFVTVFLLFWFSIKKFSWKESVSICLGAGILSSWWTIPFLSQLSFSSGQAYGNTFLDPLFVFFPYIHISFRWLTQFSLYNIFLFFGPAFLAIVSLYSFIQNQKTFSWLSKLACMSVLLLIIFPREFFHYTFPFIGIHWYRFIPFIWVLFLPVLTAGTVNFVEKLDFEFAKKYSFFQNAAIIFLVMNIIVQFIMIPLYTYQSLEFRTLSSYPMYNDAQKVVQFFQSKPKGTRMTLEMSEGFLNKQVGSLHALASWLATETEVENSAGLIAESALSISTTCPTMANISQTICWARNNISKNAFKQVPRNIHLHRMIDWGIEYFVLVQPNTIQQFQSYKDVSFVQKFGSFHIFQSKSPAQKIKSPQFRPFLYIPNGGLNPRLFSEMLLQHPNLDPYNFIVYQGNIKELTESSTQSFGGIIFGKKPEKIPLFLKKKFVEASFPKENKINELPKLKESFFIEALSKHTNILESEKIALKIEKNTIHLQGQGPSILQYSYHKDWENKQNIPLFWALPFGIYLDLPKDTEVILENRS